MGTITLYSGLIGGLLAWQYLYAHGRPFDFLTWVILTLGLFIAHGTNNLINDFTDFSRGIDKDNYFRTQYGVHPLAQGFWDKRTHLIWFGVSGLLATSAGVYAMFYTHFAPVVVWLFRIRGIDIALLHLPSQVHRHRRTFHLHHLGPAYDRRRILRAHGLWDWTVVLASIPVGLNVVTINLGKHTDKLKEDKVKGVRTLTGPARRTGGALRYDLGHRAVLLDHDLPDLRGAFLHTRPATYPHRHQACADGHPPAVGTETGSAARWISHLAALVLHCLLRA